MASTTTSRRWLAAFLLLALAALAALALRPSGGTAPAASTTAPPGASDVDARLRVTPGALGTLTLASGGVGLLDAGAGARVTRSREAGVERLEVTVEAGAAPVLALANDVRWDVDVDAGAEHVRLDLERADVRRLRLAGVAAGVDAVLPTTARSELTLGVGRSHLLYPRDAVVDANLTLGLGPTLIRIEPNAGGRLALVASSGPTTVIVDASLVVALHLSAADPPPLALEGTWWRHADVDRVTWVRAPTPQDAAAADLHVDLLAHAGAPLALTFR